MKKKDRDQDCGTLGKPKALNLAVGDDVSVGSDPNSGVKSHGLLEDLLQENALVECFQGRLVVSDVGPDLLPNGALPFGVSSEFMDGRRDGGRSCIVSCMDEQG